jgi:hypothetical protein
MANRPVPPQRAFLGLVYTDGPDAGRIDYPDVWVYAPSDATFDRLQEFGQRIKEAEARHRRFPVELIESIKDKGE